MRRHLFGERSPVADEHLGSGSGHWNLQVSTGLLQQRGRRRVRHRLPAWRFGNPDRGETGNKRRGRLEGKLRCSSPPELSCRISGSVDL